MSHRQKTLLRGAVTLTTMTACLLMPVPAAAQVSIVPDQASGGGTKTFAFRVANERKDTKSTRLELVFPQTPPIAFVQVDPAPGWRVSVRPRPLNPPMRAGDKEIGEVASSLVFEGGAVAPGEFEQFLVTMGPLPADGRLVFDATQNYANGAVARWTAASAGPAITLGSGGAPGAPAAAAAGGPGARPTEPAAMNPAADGGTGSGTGLPLYLLWGALGGAAVAIAGVWYQARRRVARTESEHTNETEASAR